ncbi:MAG: ParA family protein, partial [Deltaproteobacteria bacterium]|nr:ParA family protein [Deltaproteobacteria bacterium]
LLTVNALTASDSYLVPMQCEYYAMEGLSQLIRLVGLIHKNLNPNLKEEGILLTMFDSRNNLCHQVAGEIREHFKDQVFKSVIPRNVKLSECPSHGKPILLYDVNSKGAMSYLSLAKEIITRNEVAKTEGLVPGPTLNQGSTTQPEVTKEEAFQAEERPLQTNV